MQTYSRFAITGASLDAIIAVFRAAVDGDEGWRTDEENNAVYSEMHGEKCFWMIPPPALIGEEAGIAFGGEKLKNGRAKMKITNIVPRTISQLTMAQYNCLLLSARDLIAKEVKDSATMRLYFKSGSWSLEDVVPGTTARRMLKAYLQGFPKSFHPSDIERLDFFTVSVFRNRANFDPHDLKRYLIEDRNWSEQDASFVHNRVVVGLQVLAANRRYYRGA